MELAPIFKKAYWSLAFAGLIYVLFIFSLTFPTVQRGALYMNKVNPTRYQDVNDVEYFGFLKSQVQPFNIVTPDNETLYAWHVLPLELCPDQDKDLEATRHTGPAEDYTQTRAYRLLAENPHARVIVNLHGNAAHLGSGYRPNIYRNLVSISSPEHPVHLIAFDYRGFGKSTGTPTEEGLITDAATVISLLTSPPLSIPRSRIVIAGQSLGTAVAAGVAERLLLDSADPSDEPFAGIFLFAPFRNLPNLLDSYSFMGVLPPILSPLLAYPHFQNYVTNSILDRWDTAARLARLAGIATDGSAEKDARWADRDLDVTVFHAVNDYDIPWREGWRTFEAAIGGPKAAELGSFPYHFVSDDRAREVKVWERTGPDGNGRKRITWQKVKYGGHNEIAAQPPAALAVKRAFEGK
ncbi:hypothetical protein VTO42DRAFT_4909 [Malbranchea cinnamomea]